MILIKLHRLNLLYYVSEPIEWAILTTIGKPRRVINRQKQSAKPTIRARLPYH